MNRRHFLSLAPLILAPEPRRVYSFARAPLTYAWLVNYEVQPSPEYPNIGKIECGLYVSRRSYADDFAIGKTWDGAPSRAALVDVHDPGLATALNRGRMSEHSWIAEYREQMRRHVAT